MQKKLSEKMFYGWVIVGTMWSINFATMATGNLNLGLFILPMAQSLNSRDIPDTTMYLKQ